MSEELHCSRYYTDGLLVCLVALCAAENDVVHAAYLALALALFRRRDALRSARNRLFRWLVAYNLVVMALVLAYQAPLERLFGFDFGANPRLVRLRVDCFSLACHLPILCWCRYCMPL